MNKRTYMVRLRVAENGDPISMYISDGLHNRSAVDFHAKYNSLTGLWDILHDEMQSEGDVEERRIARDRTFADALKTLLSVVPKSYAIPTIKLVFPEGFP